MSLDFEVLLVAAVLITGLTVGWNYARRRLQADQDGALRQDSWWVELCRSLFPVILIVLIIRSFIVEPFRIPSGSMIPTLLPGDFILVSKFSYGIRLPVTNQRILGTGEPERGDVAVFRYPRNPAQDYIKRIIGLPGDRITFQDDGQLSINGEPLPRASQGMYDINEGAQQFTETMGDLEYHIVQHGNFGRPEAEYRVPEGHYFMVGDNRDRSSDSRIWGFVPEHQLVGEAFLIWMSWDVENNNINWSRIGDRIQ